VTIGQRCLEAHRAERWLVGSSNSNSNMVTYCYLWRIIKSHL